MDTWADGRKDGRQTNGPAVGRADWRAFDRAGRWMNKRAMDGGADGWMHRWKKRRIYKGRINGSRGT
eukprot:365051-Chlamydomonas_euryale.AAC.6